MAILIGRPCEGASDLDVRRSLLRRGFGVREAVGHLRGLRRMLVTKAADRFILCIGLDDPTVNARLRNELHTLLQDANGFDVPIHAIGLTRTLHHHAELGCHLHVNDRASMMRAVHLLLPTARPHFVNCLRLTDRWRGIAANDRITWNDGIHDGS